MTKGILAISNQKGGVGKTTTAVNLAAALANYQQKVLLIDIDPQGNATMGSGIDKNAQSITISNLLLADKRIEEITQKTENGYDLIPANNNLIATEIKLLQVEGRENLLQKQLRKINDNYDWIVIDCPPALNILTINAWLACTGVIIPMLCEYYSLEGLANLLQNLEDLGEKMGRKIPLAGLLRTMYDGRSRLANEISNHLREVLGDKLYRTKIPRNVKLAEAPSHGLSAVLYDKNCIGAKAYLELAREIINQ